MPELRLEDYPVLQQVWTALVELGYFKGDMRVHVHHRDEEIVLTVCPFAGAHWVDNYGSCDCSSMVIGLSLDGRVFCNFYNAYLAQATGITSRADINARVYIPDIM